MVVSKEQYAMTRPIALPDGMPAFLYITHEKYDEYTLNTRKDDYWAGR